MWYPLRIKPIYKEYLWGGRNLEKIGRQLPDGLIAESLEISCSSEGISVVDNGVFAGAALTDLLELHYEELLGSALTGKYLAADIKFPFSVKLIDVCEPLSVQVYVPDNYTNTPRQCEYAINKLWYVLSAAPGARLALGLIQDINREQFVNNIAGGTVLECLNDIDVFPGDVISIPPGLVHAGGQGTLLVEIQSQSNLLYRLYDYNRADKKGQKMPLHLIKALNVTDCRQQGKKYGGLEIRINEMARKSVLAATQFFAAELYIIDDEVEEETDGSKFYIYVFLEGETIIEYGSNFLIARQGETVLIPAAFGEYLLKGKFKGLKIYVPDLEADIIQPLKKAGYSGEEIKKNVGGFGGM